MPRSYVCFLLSAHLPYVRHAEQEDFLEEDWLLEAVAETYLPLIDALETLHRQGVPCRLALSVSPTLCEMFADDLLRARCGRRLERLHQLSADQARMHASHPQLSKITSMYEARFARLKELFRSWDGDIISRLKRLAEEGVVELLTTSATHAVLPLLKRDESVRAQVRVGARNHEKHFGRRPDGFWLPECACGRDVGRFLRAEGFAYSFVDAHGLAYASPKPRYGCYRPVRSEAGVAFFARDPESAREVWSRDEGYPGDPVYREFHRDLGFDADEDYIRSRIFPGGGRRHTGLKYHRITGEVPLGEKRFYDPEAAFKRAREHARDFVRKRLDQINRLSGVMKEPPVIACLYDAELFGHWWFEGVEFLTEVFRLLAGAEATELATPSQVLSAAGELQPCEPASSSWGYGGYFETWLNGSNDWVLPTVHAAEDSFAELGRANPRVAAQALRELLLLQASDWPFIISCNTHVDYAVRRIREHSERLGRLVAMARRGELDPAALAGMEADHPLFPELCPEDFFRKET